MNEETEAKEEQSRSAPEPRFLHPDGGAADSGSSVLGPPETDAGAGTSRRGRFLPPDQRAAPFLGRHAEAVRVAETVLAALFFLAALYFLFLWLTHAPDAAHTADREGFAAALLALPPARARASWRVPSAPGRWRGIVVHHTAGARGSVESIDRYHREENKWPNGLGYHFLIGNGDGMEDGEVAAGPRWEKQLDGAHVRMRGTPAGNSFSIGVALVGNFENAVPSAKQLASLRGLLQFLTAAYGIPPSAIAGHGQVSEKYTACPGRCFFVDELVKAL